MENYKLKDYEKILKPYIKMDKKIINFNDTEIEEYKYYRHNSPILINEINMNETVASNKLPSIKEVFKYLIGYRDD